MADKKLHKSYTKKITSLKTIDSIGFLDKVIRRLANCNFKLSQVTIDEQGVHEEFENLSIAKSGSFHWAKNPDQQDLWESSITLSEDFYEEIVNHPVPLT